MGVLFDQAGGCSIVKHLMNIAWKVLFVILMVVCSWGIHWTKQKNVFHFDNQALVEKRTGHDPNVMDLVHLLYFRAA